MKISQLFENVNTHADILLSEYKAGHIEILGMDECVSIWVESNKITHFSWEILSQCKEIIDDI